MYKQKRSHPKSKKAAAPPPQRADQRKLSALSSMLLDRPVNQYGERIEELSAMLYKEESSQKKKSGHPLFSCNAAEVKQEIIKISLAEAGKIKEAFDLTSTREYHEMCTNAVTHSVIAFPPSLHAYASRKGTQAKVKLYHNEYLNLIHTERPPPTSHCDLAHAEPSSHSSCVQKAKQINQQITTCINATTSAAELQHILKRIVMSRNDVQMERVHSDQFSAGVMTLIDRHMHRLVDSLVDTEPALNEEDALYLKLMAHSIFDNAEAQTAASALYDTKHSSVESNVRTMKSFLNAMTKRLDLDTPQSMLLSPSDIRHRDATNGFNHRVLYTGLLGSIAANALLSAYVQRCASVSQARVDKYMKMLENDYAANRLTISMVALPRCIETLHAQSPLDKRLLIINAFDRIKHSCGDESAHKQKDVGIASRVSPKGIDFANNVLSPIDSRKAEFGKSDRPIYEGSEYAFNHFNEMSTYAIRDAISSLV